MNLDYIEIGCSDFETIVQISNEELIGLSIDPMKVYLDNLPNKKNNKKINVAISDYDGKCDVYYIDPSDIIKHSLPGWLKGCNSINSPHPSAVNVLKEKGLMNIYKKMQVDAMTWDALVRKENIISVKYLKIDTEGHDCKILKNLLNSLTNILPERIEFETNSLTNQNEVLETIKLLEDRGYEIIKKDSITCVVKLSGKVVNKIIFASDSNKNFIEFWPINSEICSKRLKVTPVLFHICNEESDFYWDDFGLVKKIKSVSNQPGLEAQIFRMYGTKYFQKELCLTSDIDMLLFDKSYIKNEVYDNQSITILNSDAYSNNRSECIGIYKEGRYPICYIVGTGKMFNIVLNTNLEFIDYFHKLASMRAGYDTDELYFGMCIANSNVKCNKLKRGYSSKWFCPQRIEKRHFEDKFNQCELDFSSYIDIDSFVDCHCARPYSKYKEKIDNLVKQALD